MSNLIEFFLSRQLETIQLIRNLVESETPSGDVVRIAGMVEHLAALLRELDAKIEIFATSNGSSLYARFAEGEVESDKPLLIVGHCDTVWPLGTIAKRPFKMEDGKIYGPGVFDMKSGLVIMLEALRAIKELDLKTRRPIEVFLSCDEEQGSPSTRQLIEDIAQSAYAALVLEPCLPGGKLKTSRKGIAQYQLIARGCSAHAGVAPEKGISAVEELAQQIIKLHSLTNHTEGISVNVGVIQGGTLSNVVAAEARAEIDIRFWTNQQQQKLSTALENLKPVLNGAEIELIGKVNRPPLERSERIAELFKHAQKLSLELGFELQEGKTGGGSDGNFIAALGVPVLDGLGPDGDGAHADYEHVLIGNLAPRAALITRLLETV
ncbi:MAG: M20 family metallopeptidase [Blastocatellia bacterium]|nr:M20 family metallopeptidase [Blastocatellia bacterium]MBL8197211.1 M20 family metallopeptidase [Blastocatellia bacterium]MBN8721297.1 M20 family metallopeptidase [Acidobacteriota bacterium]